MMAASKPYLPPERFEKALRLADYLDGAGIRSRRAAAMDGAQWAMLATAAQVRVPSDDNRALALSMLRAREDARKSLACLRRRRHERADTTTERERMQ